MMSANFVALTLDRFTSGTDHLIPSYLYFTYRFNLGSIIRPEIPFQVPRILRCVRIVSSGRPMLDVSPYCQQSPEAKRHAHER